jgi:ribonucleoside-diphosphate reductase alpha chain
VESTLPDGGGRSDMAAMVQRVASTGFVRSRLTVLQGGVVSAATASLGATALETAPSLGVAHLPEEAHRPVDRRSEQVRAARAKGYEGDSCGDCGNFTLVRNGTCLKCDTCGSTSGCS